MVFLKICCTFVADNLKLIDYGKIYFDGSAVCDGCAGACD